MSSNNYDAHPADPTSRSDAGGDRSHRTNPPLNGVVNGDESVQLLNTIRQRVSAFKPKINPMTKTAFPYSPGQQSFTAHTPHVSSTSGDAETVKLTTSQIEKLKQLGAFPNTPHEKSIHLSDLANGTDEQRSVVSDTTSVPNLMDFDLGGETLSFTKSLVYQQLLEFADTQSPEVIGQLEKTLSNVVNGTDLSITHIPTSANGALEAQGRYLYETIDQLIKNCGPVFASVIENNLDLPELLTVATLAFNKQKTEYEQLLSRVGANPNLGSYPDSYYNRKAETQYADYETVLTYFMIVDWLNKVTTHTWNYDKVLSYPIHDRVQMTDVMTFTLQHEVDFLASSASASYVQYCTKIKKIVQTKVNHEYFSAMENVQAQAKLVEEQKEIGRRMSQLTKKLQTLTHVQRAFCTTATLIANKIKNAVRGHTTLISKLQGTVQFHIDNISDPISNPFDKTHLAGMREILRVEFAAANLVTFKQSLLKLLNHRVSHEQLAKDPLEGVASTINSLNMWKSAKLFSFLTEDIFWTVVFLRQYPAQSNLYQKALEHSMERIRTISDNPLTEDQLRTLLYPNMPIFTSIMEWVTKIYSPSLNFEYRKQYPNKKPIRTTESAFASIATDDLTKQSLKPAAASYNREVTRKDAVYTPSSKFPDARFLYTATKTPCPLCNRTDLSTPNPNQHEITCYCRKCSKCNLFGHRPEFCRQQNSTPSANPSTTTGATAASNAK